VLDFSRTVHEDLSNYDAASAWPVLLDEFVEALLAEAAERCGRAAAGGSRTRTPTPGLGGGGGPGGPGGGVEGIDYGAAFAAAAADPYGAPATALEPRSGSKRRAPGAPFGTAGAGDAEQLTPLLAALAHLPMVSASAGDDEGGPAAAAFAKRLRLAGGGGGGFGGFGGAAASAGGAGTSGGNAARGAFRQPPPAPLFVQFPAAAPEAACHPPARAPAAAPAPASAYAAAPAGAPLRAARHHLPPDDGVRSALGAAVSALMEPPEPFAMAP